MKGGAKKKQQPHYEKRQTKKKAHFENESYCGKEHKDMGILD